MTSLIVAAALFFAVSLAAGAIAWCLRPRPDTFFRAIEPAEGARS